MAGRPKGRTANVTGAGKSVSRRGSGLGSGPVGRPGSSRPSAGGSPSGGQQRGSSYRSGFQTQNTAGIGTGNVQRASGRRSPILLIAVVVIAVLIFGGKLGLGNLFGGGNGYESDYDYDTSAYSTAATTAYQQEQKPSSNVSSLMQMFMSGGTGVTTGTSAGWIRSSNLRSLDTSVASGIRDRYTVLKGSGNDTVTLMVYMCGTDLESRSGMASSDLQEMLNATVGSKISLLVYTGGCKQWKNNLVSSSKNQIYKIENGNIKCLVDNDGTAAMTDPDNLAKFIQYCKKNYPASRYGLIFWDHGGGSLSGYGYDEKNTSAGSMTLANIGKALKSGGTQFDFIGFDACLMATLENALILTPYADYLVASEETEPGVGWYYTDWLTALSANTSMPTIELGKKIADDFVSVCAQKCAGQKTTLSVIDLAELEAYVPDALAAFSKATVAQINDDYSAVSSARSGCREFADSSKIDQIDLVNLAYSLGTDEAEGFAETLLGCVKYNNCSSNMTNAYGISIYFPYRKTSQVTSAAKQYDAIGMDDDYTDAIKAFAAVQSTGQQAYNPYPSSGSSSSGSLGGLSALSGLGSSSSGSTDILGLLSQLMGSYGVSSSALDVNKACTFLTDNRFDGSALEWTLEGGIPLLRLPEEQWELVRNLELSVWYDDGEGYIDLGYDNLFEFTDDGALIGTYDATWLAIDDQPVAYYHLDTTENGDDWQITGRVPCLLNGDRADLIIVFSNGEPNGYIAGATRDYRDGETETQPKNIVELNEGDVIDFLCDYYTYDGEYSDSYMLGEQMTWYDGMTVSNVTVDGNCTSPMYVFTDIYENRFWLPATF